MVAPTIFNVVLHFYLYNQKVLLLYSFLFQDLYNMLTFFYYNHFLLFFLRYNSSLTPQFLHLMHLLRSNNMHFRYANNNLLLFPFRLLILLIYFLYYQLQPVLGILFYCIRTITSPFSSGHPIL